MIQIIPEKNSNNYRPISLSVVFDFDGVIIDSKDLQKKALRKCYQEYYGSGEPPYEEFFRLSGDSLFNIFKKMGLSTNLVDLYRSICSSNIAENKIITGIPELIFFLKRMKFMCGLCTGKDRSRTIAILNYFNLYYFFDVIVCSDDVINPKPHPESLYKIMKQLNVKSSNTIMIGDSINDILCAKNAGVKCISVVWEQPPYIWDDNIVIPDLQVHTIEDLRDGILKLSNS
jgi:HAD superfamily hydrolase (TIGR01509 family)